MNALEILDINPALIQKAGNDLENIMRLIGYNDEAIEKWGRYAVRKVAQQEKLGGAITNTIVDIFYKASAAAIVKKNLNVKCEWVINDDDCVFMINGKHYLEFFKRD